MKVVVTGGAGLIGREVVSQVRPSKDVVSLDIVPCPVPGVRAVRANLLDASSCDNALRGATHVVHLASKLGVEWTDANPVETLRHNSTVNINVLEAARKHDVEKIIVASSSEIYGHPHKVPIPETADLQPITAYGVSKLVLEEYTRAYSKTYGLHYVIVRYFNVYGPHQSPEFVIPRFVRMALSGDPIKVYGDGKQTRTFCHAKDAARCTILALRNREAQNVILNIGSSSETVSMNELAALVKRIAKSKSPIEMVPLKVVKRETREIFQRIPDISRARRLLGFKCTIGLKEGLEEVVSYYRDAMKPRSHRIGRS
jgi:UDP-glucose 4-epimerase